MPANHCYRAFVALLPMWVAAHALAADAQPHGGKRFADCKTFFQTNLGYDPRIAIAADAVVVHRHGDSLESLTGAIGSWKRNGFVVGRMFFADSDATNAYWKGKWDGTPHEDEVERDAGGNVIMCAGVRPYMLPTEGWVRHCEEQVKLGIQAGADAILPEEPLAHDFTGYEGAFKPLFEKRYGMPWQPENASPEAHFLTCQLKAELYLELEQRLARLTKAEAERVGRPIDFLMPVHPLYSNRASRLVAPMGSALSMKELDGYVGQVWTGPVRWCTANYSSPDKSFFTSAYALYDYFAALTSGTEKKMWLLADPVEDDPNHKWSEFEEWYRHCLVAKLMFGEIDAYEIMPWPDRIFLPGYQTGGGTPAPEDYRVSLLSAIQVLQDVPARVEDRGAWSTGFRIGIAMGDSVLWEPQQDPKLDGLYGLLIPPLMKGMWTSACPVERWTEQGYLDRFRVVVLSYEHFKPTRPEQNLALADWVKQGGVLVLLGGGGSFKGDAFWWTRLGKSSALEHLLDALGNPGTDADTQAGQGWVVRRAQSPRQFADPQAAERYLALLAEAVERAEPGAALKAPGFLRNRGSYQLIHARSRFRLDGVGPVVDVLDPKLPVVERIDVAAGASAIFRLVGSVLAGEGPVVLHCTHRLIEQSHTATRSRVVIRGPAETPGVVRLFAGARRGDVAVRTSAGEPLDARVDVDDEFRTLLIRFPNVPAGAVIEIAWKSPPSP